jgi:hypothetical protein
MKIKTSELTSTPLAWAVAQALKLEIDSTEKTVLFYEGEPFLPDTYWHQGGPIIEREGITVAKGNRVYFPQGNEKGDYYEDLWRARLSPPDSWTHGTTPLIAAMRCFVAAHLGDECDIPDELITGE